MDPGRLSEPPHRYARGPRRADLRLTSNDPNDSNVSNDSNDPNVSNDSNVSNDPNDFIS
jgi:hypothetical protein